MFKHQAHSAAVDETKEEKNSSGVLADKKGIAALPAVARNDNAKLVASEDLKDASPQALRELLEKNLKWSQIIYEQNRRLNHKLAWTAVANWLRLLVIAASLVSAFLFLSPLVKQLMGNFGNLLNGVKSGSGAPSSSLDDILKLLPINPAQKEQIKAMLK